MSKVDLVFSSTLTPCDPAKHPVLIVGQLKNLLQLGYERVKVKLQPRVSKEVRFIKVEILKTILSPCYGLRQLCNG